MKDFIIVASRGRYVNGTSETAQNFEINDTGCTNALTTVCKDNYVIEIEYEAVDEASSTIQK